MLGNMADIGERVLAWIGRDPGRIVGRGRCRAGPFGVTRDLQCHIS